MILIVGASGRLGKAIAERLLEAGTPFRVACRDVAKAQWLSDSGIEVFRLDVATGAGLTEAIAGATRVISCIHGLLGKSRQSIEQIDVCGQAALIDASIAAGVQRFVFVSTLGASPNHPAEFWKAKAQTEAYLRASGMEYVILRPSAFMDLYAHDLIGAAVMRGKTVYLLGSGSTPRNMIAVADVAEVAVKALMQDDLAGQTLEIGAAGNPTERDVAAVYAQLTGKPIKVRTIPAGALRVLASAVGPFHRGIGRVLRLPLQLAGRADSCIDATDTMGRLNVVPIGLAEFAARKVREAGRSLV